MLLPVDSEWAILVQVQFCGVLRWIWTSIREVGTFPGSLNVNRSSTKFYEHHYIVITDNFMGLPGAEILHKGSEAQMCLGSVWILMCLFCVAVWSPTSVVLVMRRFPGRRAVLLVWPLTSDLRHRAQSHLVSTCVTYMTVINMLRQTETKFLKKKLHDFKTHSLEVSSNSLKKFIPTFEGSPPPKLNIQHPMTLP